MISVFIHTGIIGSNLVSQLRLKNEFIECPQTFCLVRHLSYTWKVAILVSLNTVQYYIGLPKKFVRFIK